MKKTALQQAIDKLKELDNRIEDPHGIMTHGIAELRKLLPTEREQIEEANDEARDSNYFTNTYGND